MNNRKVMGFCAAAKYGSFSKAASSIYMTQPAFSRMISSLEEELGCELFRRSKTETVLTPIGREILPEMQEVLRHYQKIEQLTSHYKPRTEKTIVIGEFCFGWADESRAACAAYLRLHPDVSIRIQEISGTNAFQGLQTGEIDLLHTMYAPTRYRSHQSLLKTLPCEPYRHCAYMSTSHPLAYEPEISLRQLEKDPFIFFSRDQFPLMYDRVCAACADVGFIPDVAFETENLSHMMNHVATGDGVAVIPNFAAEVPGVKAVPIREMPAEPSFWFWHHENDQPQVLDFIEFLTKLAQVKGRITNEP